MARLGKFTHEDKRPIRVGLVLMISALVLILLVVKIDAISAGIGAVADALAPFLYGIALAYFLNVFVQLFEKIVFKPINKKVKSKFWLKARRPISIALSLILICVILLFITLYIVPELTSSIVSLAESAQKNVPGYVDAAIEWLNKFIDDNNLMTGINSFFESFNWQSLITNATQFTTNFVTTILDATKNVFSAVSTFVIAFIFSIYLLSGKEKLLVSTKAFIFAFLPEKAAKRITNVSTLSNHVFYSFIKGQLLEALIMGTLCYIGMVIFRFDYALLISSIIMLTALVPILGAYIGAIIGALVLLISNPIDAVWFLIFIIVLQQLEGNLIYPRVVGSSMGLPTIWTMFAVFFCGTLFGIPGVLLGTPITAVIYKLLRHSTNRRLDRKGINRSRFEDTPNLTSSTAPLPEAQVSEPEKNGK